MRACESAGLPLLRIRAARGYGVVDIRQQIEAVLFPVQQDSSLEKPEQLEGQGVEVTVSEQERADSQTERQVGKPIEASTVAEVAAQPVEPVAPACRQCGEVMVLRKARSGKYAGQQFWGCSAFPKCRGARKR